MRSLRILVNILEEFLRIYRMKIDLQKIHQGSILKCKVHAWPIMVFWYC